MCTSLPVREKCPYSELFWSAFSRIWTSYGETLRISPYSVRMRENANQNNSGYEHFFTQFTVGTNNWSQNRLKVQFYVIQLKVNNHTTEIRFFPQTFLMMYNNLKINMEREEILKRSFVFALLLSELPRILSHINVMGKKVVGS